MNELLARIHAELGIPATYARECNMPLQQECPNLVQIEPDVYGRPAWLEARTSTAWETMKTAALADGVELQLVSAYRSVEYQKQLFLRKLARGDLIAAILNVNAAPGFSEHHSGRAVDVGCPGFPPLEESFDTSPAFDWLQVHAAVFGFRISFPRNNPFGVLYEPWHWYFVGVQE